MSDDFEEFFDKLRDESSPKKPPKPYVGKCPICKTPFIILRVKYPEGIECDTFTGKQKCMEHVKRQCTTCPFVIISHITSQFI